MIEEKSINWEKAAKRYEMSIPELQVKLEKHPSNTTVPAICTKCGMEHEVRFNRYRDLCRSCVQKGNTNGRNSTGFKGHKHTTKAKKKMSDSHKGNPGGKGNKGRKHTDKEKKKMSIAMMGKKFTSEHCRAISASLQHIQYDKWEKNTKDQKYCPLFNERCRESNREKYGRKCFICGLSESENITKTGKVRKLSVHHVDMDKQQGCDGKRWKLVPVCMHHHNHSELWEARIVWLLENIW